jgi:hypothetical protein
MSVKAFRRESNGFEPSQHIPRPTANHAAFKDLTPEALSVAQEMWDEANQARINYEAMQKRSQEYFDSEEGQEARRAQRSMYQGM